MEQLQSPILVIVDNDLDAEEPRLSVSSQRLVGLARTLTTGKVYAQSIAEDADIAGLGQAGADVVFVPTSAGYSPLVPQSIADITKAALAQVDGGEGVGAVLTTGTYLGRAVTGILSASLNVGGGVDVTDVSVVDGKILATKSALGGSWITQFRAVDGFPILAVRAGVGVDEDAQAPSSAEVDADVDVVELAPELSTAALAVEVVSSEHEPKGARASLSDADVVVVGGRGVDGDFTLVESLADALGGAVGATRVACDEGWVARSAQIGQTGVNIAPKIYIGLGVSGAVHHTCGMLGAETIVAVVDDPDAPIVEIADFTVIGDVADVIPQALAALSSDA